MSIADGESIKSLFRFIVLSVEIRALKLIKKYYGIDLTKVTISYDKINVFQFFLQLTPQK